MFEKMRRSKQELPREEVDRILRESTSGVLSVVDADGYPYGVPLSYVRTGGRIYFHSAKAGHKITAIGEGGKATFCVVSKDDVCPEAYSTRYESVIAFGTVSVVSDGEEALSAMRALGEKYRPDHGGELQAELEKYRAAFAVLRFDVLHVTGKRSKRSS